jgi:hypothetical protein
MIVTLVDHSILFAWTDKIGVMQKRYQDRVDAHKAEIDAMHQQMEMAFAFLRDIAREFTSYGFVIFNK